MLPGYNNHMSTLIEIKKAASTLNHDERLVLHGYLSDLEEQRSDEFVTSVTEEMRRMDKGEKISIEEFTKLHEHMKKLGL